MLAHVARFWVDLCTIEVPMELIMVNERLRPFLTLREPRFELLRRQLKVEVDDFLCRNRRPADCVVQITAPRYRIRDLHRQYRLAHVRICEQDADLILEPE